MAEGNKSEKATPKKRRDERKKGNVFLSKDAIAVASLLSTFLILKWTAGSIALELEHFFYLCFEYIRDQGQLPVILGELVYEVIFIVVKTAGPIVAMAVAAAVISTFWQTKLLVSSDSLKPKFNRISPLQGFKRLFSLKSIVEALKNLLKIIILLYIIYHYLQGIFSSFSNYLYIDLAASSAHLFDETFTMVMQVTVAFAVLAGFDFFYQWWDYERQLRMTKQEVKEEYKQTEGDPQIKGKIKEAQRKMARSRMMQKVPQADVIIRNPTHVAVALRYQPDTDDAPIVLAKGLDELALRIVQVAEESHVAVVENVPLARNLYASAELDQEIPAEFYAAVADVLVYVYRLDSNQNKQ